jgi:hypothetical protein
MLNLLRTHAKKIFTGLLLATAIGSGGLTIYERTASCCSAGSPCCHPGSPCCHGHGAGATASR